MCQWRGLHSKQSAERIRSRLLTQFAPRLRGPAFGIALAVLVSRLLGFVKVVVLVAVIGGTAAHVGGQAFEVASSVPQYVFRLISSGVLGAVLLPSLVRAMQQGEQGQRFVNQLFTIALWGGLAVTALLMIGAPLLVNLYAYQWSPAWKGLTVQMMYWCIPQLFFLIVFAVLSQVLNANKRFQAAAWAPACSNLVGIAGLLVFAWLLPSGLGPVESWSPTMVAVLCGSATLATAVQTAILIIATARSGIRLRLRFSVSGMRLVSELAGWTFAGAIFGQVATITIANVANAAGEAINVAGADGASFNTLATATLIVLVPHGVFTVALVTSAFPDIALNASRPNDPRFIDGAASVSRKINSLMLFAVVVIVLTAPTLSLIAWGTPHVGTVAQILAVGVLAISQTYLLNRVSLARNNAKAPFYAQLTVASVTVTGTLIASLALPSHLVVPAIAATIALANISGWIASSLHLRFVSKVTYPTMLPLSDWPPVAAALITLVSFSLWGVTILRDAPRIVPLFIFCAAATLCYFACLAGGRALQRHWRAAEA